MAPHTTTLRRPVSPPPIEDGKPKFSPPSRYRFDRQQPPVLLIRDLLSAWAPVSFTGLTPLPSFRSATIEFWTYPMATVILFFVHFLGHRSEGGFSLQLCCTMRGSAFLGVTIIS